MNLLQTVGLSKFYPGVRALDGVDFDLRAGEVHILFGENGAGKSTLISLLAGANSPTAGSILFNGRAVSLGSVREARRLGISAVFQEFSLVPTLTVAQNLFLGDEPARHGWLDRSAMRERAQQALAELGFEIDPDALVASLSRAEQQMIEIAKSQRGTLAVLILDEPTASLTERETVRLFELVERLKARGVGIVYISHRMQEIDRIGDRITLLRDGRKVTTLPAKTTSHDTLIELMTGRSIEHVYPNIQANPGETVLEVEGLCTRSGVRNASIRVRRGEVVGLAGLVGSGKSELMRAVYGLDRVIAGSVRFRGADCTGASTARILCSGMFYLPPDRKTEGLILGFASKANVVLPMLAGRLRGSLGFVKAEEGERASKAVAERVELAPRNVGRIVGLLSGGNQQKVMFAKGLTGEAALYVFDEPTVGVDVGTRTALYRLIQELCEGGAAVVVISSDMPEILHLAHRAYVMCRGQVAGELARAELTEANLLTLFFDRERVA
jgi:ribose transport system ATP-binding protein